VIGEKKEARKPPERGRAESLTRSSSYTNCKSGKRDREISEGERISFR